MSCYPLHLSETVGNISHFQWLSWCLKSLISFFFIFKIMTEKSSAGPYYEPRKGAQSVFLEIFIRLVLEVSGPWLRAQHLASSLGPFGKLLEPVPAEQTSSERLFDYPSGYATFLKCISIHSIQVNLKFILDSHFIMILLPKLQFLFLACRAIVCDFSKTSRLKSEAYGASTNSFKSYRQVWTLDLFSHVALSLEISAFVFHFSGHHSDIPFPSEG